MKTAGRLLFGLILALFFPVLAFGQDCLPNGDMNGDGSTLPSDIPPLQACVFLGGPCPALPLGDLNCDGFRDLADYLLELHCVFLGSPGPLGPCPIANVRPTIADPRDQIVLDDRVIYPPGGGSPYTSLRVWITNKDPLMGLSLPLSEVTEEGPGFTFAVLPGGGGSVTRLSPFWEFAGGNFGPPFYTGTSPSSFFVYGTTKYTSDSTEPPNATPRAILDINFDNVLPPCGTVWFDSLTVPGGILDHTVFFVDANYRRVPVNFLRGRLALKGDINFDGVLSSSDFVAQLNCVFLGIGPCPLCPGDINSDNTLTPLDAVRLANGVYLGAFAP